VILDGGGAGPVVTQTRGLLKGLTVRGGVAANGAGISLVEALDARVEDVLVTGNVATMRGGGAYVLDADGRIALVDVELRGNRTTSTHTTSGGGGLFVMDSAVLLDGVRLLDNDTKGLGGGLRLLAPAHRAEITDLVAEGNTADEQAGVSIENADVDGLVLRDNTSTSSWPAGAITKSNVVGVEARGNYTPVTFDGALLLVESDADEVRVVDNAGGRRALEVRGPAARLTRAAILDNDVTEGLFVLDGAELWSLLVAGNRDIGLAVSYGSGAQTVRHATIVGNGGVGLRYGTAGGAVVSSAIVARNGTGVFRQNTSVYPRYTAVYGNSTNWGFPPPTGANNLTVDCALVRTTGPSAESWDLHLSADSPCRGAAEPGLGGTPDLGAYGGPYGAW
jgi:hypothetical protein